MEKICSIGQADDDSTGAHARTHTHTHTHTHTLTHSLTLSQNMYYRLIFHGNNGYANAPHCYVIRTLPVFLNTGRVLDVSHVLVSYLRHEEGCLSFDGHSAFCDTLLMAIGSVHLPAFLAVVRTCHGCRAPFRIETDIKVHGSSCEVPIILDRF